MITVLTYLTWEELINAQLACKDFYEDKVPQAFFTIRIPRKLVA